MHLCQKLFIKFSRKFMSRILGNEIRVNNVLLLSFEFLQNIDYSYMTFHFRGN